MFGEMLPLIYKMYYMSYYFCLFFIWIIVINLFFLVTVGNQTVPLMRR